MKEGQKKAENSFHPPVIPEATASVRVLLPAAAKGTENAATPGEQFEWRFRACVRGRQVTAFYMHVVHELGLTAAFASSRDDFQGQPRLVHLS